MSRTFDDPNPKVTPGTTDADKLGSFEHTEPDTTSASAKPNGPLSAPHIRLPDDSLMAAEGASAAPSARPASPAVSALLRTKFDSSAPAPAAEPTTLRELQTVLRQMDSHFIFPVGSGGTGKTVVLYSMLRYLLTANTVGKLYPFNSPWKAVDRTSQILSEVSNMFREARMPSGTKVADAARGINVTKQANYEFSPSNNKHPKRRFTFVDIGGENFDDFVKTDSLPMGVDVFFQVGGLSLTFLLMTTPSRAEKDDHLFSLFLGHIAKRDPAFRNARAMVILTQWDTYGGTETAESFVENWMPMTYAATRNPANALMSFTVGTVGKTNDGGDWIVDFNPAPARALFRWIYQSVAHVDLDAKPWWQRFLKAI